MSRKSIALNQSLLYDGGGTSNALQTLTTSATLVAAALDLVRISGPIAALRIDLLASAAAKGCVLTVTEFRDESPAVNEVLSVREVAIPATDHTMTVDRASWGLTTGTEIYAKPAVVVPVTPGRHVTISCASTDGSVSWYARVTALDNQAATAEANAGGVTTGAVSTVTVGNTTGGTLIAAADATRQFLHITNMADELVYLNVAGGAAVSTKGIPLGKAGTEAPGDSYTAQGKPAQLAVYGICASGSKAVAVQTLTTAL